MSLKKGSTWANPKLQAKGNASEEDTETCVTKCDNVTLIKGDGNKNVVSKQLRFQTQQSMKSGSNLSLSQGWPKSGFFWVFLGFLGKNRHSNTS